MPISNGTMSMFVNAMSKWLAAIERHDHADAGFYANEVRVAGKVLSIDPEFKRLFATQTPACADSDPETVVECIGAFVLALTEAGRARPNNHGVN